MCTIAMQGRWGEMGRCVGTSQVHNAMHVGRPQHGASQVYTRHAWG